MLAKKIALGCGIAVILPIMIHFGVEILVEDPMQGDYQVEAYYETMRNNDLSDSEKEQVREEQKALDELFEERKKRFQLILFSVAVPLGITAILIGTFLKSKGLGTGLIFGGLFSTVNGYMHHWQSIGETIIFVSMLIIFLILIYISMKKIDRDQ